VNYVVEIGTDALTYIPSFIKIVSGIQKLISGIYIQTHTQSKVISQAYIYFFQNNESRLKLRCLPVSAFVCNNSRTVKLHL
jgi:hypothetical protein